MAEEEKIIKLLLIYSVSIGSMRKSNWSDLPRAFEMSARESVRRLFASATMNARAVISAMNTAALSQPLQKNNTHVR